MTTATYKLVEKTRGQHYGKVWRTEEMSASDALSANARITVMQWEPANPPRHLLETLGLDGMADFYRLIGAVATSTVADTALILSHIAYHSGQAEAERVTVKPSRGHSYRVTGGRLKANAVVRITDHFDHRNGVKGWID